MGAWLALGGPRAARTWCRTESSQSLTQQYSTIITCPTAVPGSRTWYAGAYGINVTERIRSSIGSSIALCLFSRGRYS